MITDFAVSLSILMERERKLAEIEKRRQHEFARSGAIAVPAKRESVLSKVISFAQGFRSEQAEQAVPCGLAGDAAA